MANGNSTAYMLLLLTLLLHLLSLLTISSKGLQYAVGDSIWSIPITNDFYTNWSSSYSFHVGDTLYFDFDSSGMYDLMEVSRGDYDSCSGDNNAFKEFVDGPISFPLNEKGVFYFICSISNYCRLGLKVSVVVNPANSDASSTSSPAYSPSPVSSQIIDLHN